MQYRNTYEIHANLVRTKTIIASTKDDRFPVRLTLHLLHHDLENKEAGLVTASLRLFLQIILRLVCVLRSLATCLYLVKIVWFTRESRVSLSRYSAEDTISASFCYLFWLPSIVPSDLLNLK